MNQTNGSRGIRNSWHFHYALILLIKVVCSSFGIVFAPPPKQVVMQK
ncbi:TPA: DUF3265 domain-containing protein [Aeromonas hydrophila]|nr:DUF3265 domain-containing protein [Aeromonas hydrophila]